MATRWFVEVSALDAEGLKERYCVEAHQWQQALQAARKLRGDAGPLSRFAIEVTDSGHRAVDPAARLRYLVSKAPPGAELSDGTVPPSSRPAVTATPTEPTPTPALPGARLLIERTEEPTDEVPITYREYAFAVAPWATNDELRTMLESLHGQIVEALTHRGQGKFVQLALFDHIFEGRPQRPPRATLAWKDWRGDPIIKVDDDAAADAAVSGSAATEPAPHATAEAPASNRAAAGAPPSNRAAAGAPPSNRAAAGAPPSNRAAAASGRAAPTPARGATPEPLPEPGHRPRLAVDVDQLKFSPTPPPARPKAVASPAAAAPPKPGPAEPEGSRLEREPTPSEAAPTVPHEVAPNQPAGTRPPTPSEAAPTVRHPQVVATSDATSAPTDASDTVSVTEPPMEAAVPPAGAVATAEAVRTTPTGAFPLVEVRKTGQAITEPKGSPAASASPPAAAEAEAAPRTSSTTAPQPPEDEPPPPATEPATKAEAKPAKPAKAKPAKAEAKPAKAEAKPAKAEAAAAPEPAPASEPLSTRPAPPSHAERRRRGPDEDLISDLFDRMGDLHFIHDLLDGADHVLVTLWELLPCEGTIIHVYDINREQFVLVRAAGPRPEAALLLRTPDDTPLFQEALRSGRVVSSEGEVGIDPFLGERWDLLGVEPRHALCGPVLYGGRFLGIIELANPITAEPFREDEVNALLYVCEQLADFVENRPIVLDDGLILSQA